MAKCHIPFLGYCDLDLVFRIIMFGAFFSILFELGIPNLVCGCILRWQCHVSALVDTITTCKSSVTCLLSKVLMCITLINSIGQV